MKFNSFKYEKFELQNSGIRMPIFMMKNLSIVNDEKFNTIKVPGKTFLFFLTPYFGHIMIEGIFQYEFLKYNIKDINPFFVYGEDPDKNKEEDFLENYMEDIIKIYNGNVNLIYHSNYEFEEVYFVFQDVSCFDSSMYEKDDLDSLPWFNEPYWEGNVTPDGKTNIRESYGLHDLYTIGGQLFKSRMDKVLDLDASMPKKIFISRKMTNHKYLFGEEEWKKVGSWRMSDLEDIIEDYFISHGYTSIFFESMGYIDQLTYLKNADKIAGFAGSCFWSFCVCKQETAIHEIMSPKQKHGSYWLALGKLGITDYHVYTINDELNKDSVTKEILDEMFPSID